MENIETTCFKKCQEVFSNSYFIAFRRVQTD